MAKKTSEDERLAKVAAAPNYGDPRFLYSLDDIDLRMLATLIRHPGIKIVDLAKIVGIERNHCRIRRNKPAFVRKLLEVTRSEPEMLRDNWVETLRRLGELVKDSDKWVALDAAKVMTKIYEVASLARQRDATEVPPKGLDIIELIESGNCKQDC